MTHPVREINHAVISTSRRSSGRQSGFRSKILHTLFHASDIRSTVKTAYDFPS